MSRVPTELTRTDARTFALLADGPLTSRQAGALLHRSPNTALRSLQRLVLHGLATATAGERCGFATGTPAYRWARVLGATFPGPAPRKPYTLHPAGREVDELPPVRIRRAGTVPTEVAQGIGLAGLVRQLQAKD